MRLVYGIHPVTNAIKSGRAGKIILAESKRESSRVFLAAKRKGISIEYWSNDKFDKIFLGSNHQLCAAECADLTLHKIDDILRDRVVQSDYNSLYLALDGITDPHNFGACIRSALAFSCQGIIFAGNNSAALNAACAKSSAGMIEWMPLYKVSNLARGLKQMQDRGYWIVAAGSDAKMQLNQLDCRRPLILLLGSEGKGVSRLLLENSDYSCCIPIDDRVESLNVSTACAVLLYHIRSNQI